MGSLKRSDSEVSGISWCSFQLRWSSRSRSSAMSMAEVRPRSWLAKPLVGRDSKMMVSPDNSLAEGFLSMECKALTKFRSMISVALVFRPHCSSMRRWANVLETRSGEDSARPL